MARPKPPPMNATTPPYAGLHANGTGPFILVSHEPGVKTVWKKNPNWWDKPIGNVDEVVFTPIANAATRVAALLSGEIDWMDPVPLNDQDRVNANPGTQVLAGPEVRTIFFGMDQSRDELGHSSVKGKNPFKDVRVRKAFYQAIDEDAINKKVMRGQATPSALMISPRPIFAIEGLQAVPVRSRGVEKTARRGRLSRWVRGAARLSERPLRQRRANLSGGRRHARAGRRQGGPQRRTEIEIFRGHIGGGRVRQLFLSPRMDADDARELQRLSIYHGLSRPEDQLGRQQCGRLLQSESR